MRVSARKAYENTQLLIIRRQANQKWRMFSVGRNITPFLISPINSTGVWFPLWTLVLQRFTHLRQTECFKRPSRGMTPEMALYWLGSETGGGAESCHFVRRSNIWKQPYAFILRILKLFYFDFNFFHIEIKFLTWAGDLTAVKGEFGVILQAGLKESLGIGSIYTPHTKQTSRSKCMNLWQHATVWLTTLFI